MAVPPVCNSGFMNVKEALTYAANEGIWVLLGWAVIGMFVITMAGMVAVLVALIVT
jgi:hypothetical protein